MYTNSVRRPSYPRNTTFYTWPRYNLCSAVVLAYLGECYPSLALHVLPLPSGAVSVVQGSRCLRLGPELATGATALTRDSLEALLYGLDDWLGEQHRCHAWMQWQLPPTLRRFMA